MKRIAPYIIYLFLVIPTGLFANMSVSAYNGFSDTSSFSVSSKSLILRGSLSSFHANYGRNYFELNWNTIAGDFDYFVVERSLDGQKYETIGTVKNTTENSGSYNFRDNFKTVVALNNDFYYRLKQVEANGNIVYSKVLIARMFNTHSLASLSITPDPQANDILVNVQLHEDSYVMLKVSDEKGNMILKEGKKAENGANTYTLEGTHNLSPGMYTLEITVNSRERMVMKLMKG